MPAGIELSLRTTKMPLSTQSNFTSESDDVHVVVEAFDSSIGAAYDLTNKSKKKLALQTIVAFLTVAVCAGSSLIVSWANEVPSVQFDFTKGTTARDLFNPHTLIPRSACGTDAGRTGGGGLAFSASTSCWNGYFKDDVWQVLIQF